MAIVPHGFNDFSFQKSKGVSIRILGADHLSPVAGRSFGPMQITRSKCCFFTLLSSLVVNNSGIIETLFGEGKS